MANLLVTIWGAILLMILISLGGCGKKDPTTHLSKDQNTIDRCQKILVQTKALVVANCDGVTLVSRDYVIEKL